MCNKFYLKNTSDVVFAKGHFETNEIIHNRFRIFSDKTVISESFPMIALDILKCNF